MTMTTMMVRIIRQRGFFVGWRGLGDATSSSRTACSAAAYSTSRIEEQQDGGGIQNGPCKVTDIVYDSKENRVRLTFDSGEVYSYSSEYLRTQSPAATASMRGSVVSGRKYVGIMDIRPVGRYGVQFCFDDLHTTGLFTYEYLLHLGRHKYSIMKQYIKALESVQASRDPRKNAPGGRKKKKK